MASVKICALDELPVNEAVRVIIDETPIAVVRDAADVVHAIGDTCTHGDVSLSEGFVEGETLECWAHGSKFSLVTGAALTLPAFEAVPVYEVTMIDGDVFIDPTVLIPY